MSDTASKLLDKFDLAEFLRVHPSWVENHTRKGEIPCLKVGRKSCYDPNSPEFQKWLASLKRNGYDSPESGNEGPFTKGGNMARSSCQEGSIVWRKRKGGRVAMLRYRLRHNGRWVDKKETLRNEKGEYCRTEPEARKAAEKRMREINRLNSNQHTQMTMAEFVGGLWKHYQASKGTKPSTAYNYQSKLNCHILPAFGQKLLSEIRPADVTAFFVGLEREGLSGASRRVVYSLLRSIFEVAVEYELIETSPVKKKLHRPAIEQQEKPVLTAEEIRRVIEAVDAEYKPLFICLALTGLRIGELLALRWKDVDFERRRLTVAHNLWRGYLTSPKTKGSKREQHIPDALEVALRAHLHCSPFTEPDDFVFAKPDGTPLNQDRLRLSVLYPALGTAGIERGEGTHGFHLFRHSAATIVHALTRDIVLTQELLGHTRLSTTADLYTHNRSAAEQATETLAREIGSCGLFVAQTSAKVN